MTKAAPKERELLPRSEALKLLSAKADYEFDGITYHLHMSHRVILQWERLTGLSYFADLSEVLGRPTLKALSAMLFCLIADSGYEGTLEAVQQSLQRLTVFKAAIGAVNTAFIASQVDPEDDPVPPEPTPAE